MKKLSILCLCIINVSLIGMERHGSAEEYENKQITEQEFIEAVKAGKVMLVMALLAAGVDVDARGTDKLGNTALTFAAQKGHKKIIKKLLRAGAEINKGTKSPYADLARFDGITPLLYAVSYGNLSIIKMLIRKGANIDIVSRSGLTQ